VGITQSRQAALTRCLAHSPEAGRPIREARNDVIADVVAESGDLVYEPGILKDMQCMSCGLAGHAVVRAKAGDRGRCTTGYEFLLR